MLLYIITSKIRRKFRNGTVFHTNEPSQGFCDPRTAGACQQAGDPFVCRRYARTRALPVDKIKAATDAVLEEQGKVALQYSSTNGFEHFRQQIADRMEAKLNIKTTADNILVTSGSQQGLDYSARVFCDKGDVVIIESPSAR